MCLPRAHLGTHISCHQGPWAPRKIPNPEHFDDPAPLSHIGKIGAVAIEIWTMDSGIFFDDVVITNDVDEAYQIREQLWRKKTDVEVRLCLRRTCVGIALRSTAVLMSAVRMSSQRHGNSDLQPLVMHLLIHDQWVHYCYMCLSCTRGQVAHHRPAFLSAVSLLC